MKTNLIEKTDTAALAREITTSSIQKSFQDTRELSHKRARDLEPLKEALQMARPHQRKTKVINGPLGKVTLVYPAPEPAPIRTKQQNPKHNSQVRRQRPPAPDGKIPLWHGYKRPDGAQVIRVIGRNQKAAQSARYDSQGLVKRIAKKAGDIKGRIAKALKITGRKK